MVALSFTSAASLQFTCMVYKFPKDKVIRHAGPKALKIFSCSTQLSMEFILLKKCLNATQSLAIVSILTFNSLINTTYEFESKKSLFSVF